LLSGILKCADAAIEKAEQLAAEIRQYQTDKEEREKESIANVVEDVNQIEFARGSEPEFQYRAEAFEVNERRNTEKAADTLEQEASKPPVTKSR
jgi:plasmid segregation protein ParM